MASKTGNRPVYSTEKCSVCGWPKHDCRCSGRLAKADGGKRDGAKGKSSAGFPADGVVRVSRQTKGRKGKGVTLIHGVPLPAAELKALGKALKQRCGTGGTVKDGVIEIQGDHRDTVVPELESKGFKVKRSGG